MAKSIARPSVKILLSPSGAIAQLGERIVRNDEVVGSIPTSSTKKSHWNHFQIQLMDSFAKKLPKN
jgi:hypothetical protein